MRCRRRKFLELTLGAGAAALLAPASAGSRAQAQADNRPTKLMTIYVGGGVHWEHFFSPFRNPASIGSLLGGTSPTPLFDGDQLENFDGTGNDAAGSPIRRLRGPVRWDWDDPANYDAPHRSGSGLNDNKGYVWAAPEHQLYNDCVVIHGVDQQTAAHPSGKVASVCGIAGSTFARPSIHALVANLGLRFPERVVPSVQLTRDRAPQLNLPAAVSPTHIRAAADLRWQLSDSPDHWDGFRRRTAGTVPGFDAMSPEEVEATLLERYALDSVARQSGRAGSSGTERVLEQLYDNYVGVSRTLAADVVNVLENTPEFEYWPFEGPSWTRASLLGWRQGYADGGDSGNDFRQRFGLALRFLKSGLTSSVGLNMGPYDFDNHQANIDSYFQQAFTFRGVMETIGQVLVEMKNTPSGDRSLLDDTLVYIYSDFGRTFVGDDHNPMTSAILVGGGIRGNQMIGGFDDTVLGGDIDLENVEEGGGTIRRPPKSQDVIATMLAAFGMNHDDPNFFLPGGYGVVDGIIESG